MARRCKYVAFDTLIQLSESSTPGPALAAARRGWASLKRRGVAGKPDVGTHGIATTVWVTQMCDRKDRVIWEDGHTVDYAVKRVNPWRRRG